MNDLGNMSPSLLVCRQAEGRWWETREADSNAGSKD